MAVPTPPTAGEPIAEAWGDVVHDAVVAQDIQAGQINATATAVAAFDSVLVFPRPFASAPIVVLGSTGSNTVLCQFATFASTTQITFRWFKRDGTNLTAGGVSCYWMAIGPRA